MYSIVIMYLFIITGIPRPEACDNRKALLLQLDQGFPVPAQIGESLHTALPRQEQGSQPPSYQPCHH